MQVLEFAFNAGPSRRCRAVVGEGALEGLVEELRSRDASERVVLVTDSVVGPLHAEPLQRRLSTRGVETLLLDFAAGEAHKSRETKAALEDALLERGVGRDALLVAVGGGVVGDLTSFVAATWHRGVPVLQAPTTLLSMVDAALGGKTAINLPGGKNLVGAFHQPDALFADTSVLRTLPEPVYREGLAEIVKSALVADRELFEWLERSSESLTARDPETLARTVSSCLRIKGRIVERDEREAGLRAVLNCGHTVAHAIEAEAGFRISHGEAVAIGLVVESRLAAEMTGFPAEHADRLRRLLEICGLPTRVPSDLDPDRLVVAARRDKKTRAGKIRCALPRQIGRMMPGEQVTLEVAEKRLRAALD